MNGTQLTPVMLERATEQLRQERETFDQAKRHEGRWFVLRLVMGYSSVFLLAGIMVVASYVLFNNSQFPASVVAASGAALFVDVLGLLAAVWKIALNPNFYARLGAVTVVGLPDFGSATGVADLPTQEGNLHVIEAAYGARDHRVDVTKQLNARIVDSKLHVYVGNQLAGDPCPNTPKELVIRYRYQGREYSKTFKEGADLDLP